MRVVLDANVLISALITPQGAMAQVLADWRLGAFELVLSPVILTEIERVVRYPRIQEKYSLPDDKILAFISSLSDQVIMIEPQERLDVVADDPDDNKYTECAVEGRAEIIVSGDRHLTKIRTYRGIRILNPQEFSAFLRFADVMNLS